MDVLGIVAIIAAIASLIILMFKGFHTYAACMVAVVILGLFGRVGGVVPAFNYWVAGIAGAIPTYWMLFISGSLMGFVMRYSGAAISIGKAIVKILPRPLLPVAILITSTLLGYGGISVFTGFFIIVPIAEEVFRQADLPVYLMPGAIVGGGTMAEIMPGSMRIQNVVPYNLLTAQGHEMTLMYGGTIAWVGAFIGYMTMIIMYMLMVNKARKRGDGYAKITQGPCANLEIDESTLPHPILAFIPMVTTIVLLNFRVNGAALFSQTYIPLFIGAGISLILQWKYLDVKTLLKKDLGAALVSTVNVLLSYVTVIAVATVIQHTEVFPKLISALIGISAPPLIAVFLISNVTAGLTGSSMGAEGIVIPLLSGPFVDTLGINAGAFARVIAFSVEGLNTLPQNGGVLAIITACGETHKSSYMPVFWLTVVGTSIMGLSSAILYSIFL